MRMPTKYLKWKCEILTDKYQFWNKPALKGAKY